MKGPETGCVMRSVFDSESFWSGCQIYRVIGATPDIIEGAISFALSQLGKGYGFSVGYDADNFWWYCSKLVAAAYMSQGIEFPIAEKHSIKYYPHNLISEDCLYKVFLPTC